MSSSYVAPTSSSRRKSACPAAPAIPVIDSKTWWANTIQDDVHLARADGRHLPVEDADRLEVAVEHVADPGVAPAQHRRRCRSGRLASSQARPRSMSRGAPDVGDGEVVPGAGPGQVAAPARCRPACVRGRGTRTWSRRPGSRAARRRRRPCCPGAGAAPRRRRRRASCRRSCRAARRGGTSPSIRSIRKNGVPSTSPVGSIQRTCGTGTSRALADDPDRVVLVLERVVREDRQVLGRGRDPGDVLARRAARRPRSRWRRAAASPTTCRWPRCRCAA